MIGPDPGAGPRDPGFGALAKAFGQAIRLRAVAGAGIAPRVRACEACQARDTFPMGDADFTSEAGLRTRLSRGGRRCGRKGLGRLASLAAAWYGRALRRLLVAIWLLGTRLVA